MFISHLFSTIQDRQANPRPQSYTSELLSAGPERLAQKVGEEAVEVVIAALGTDNGRLVSEMADLTYHCLVLLAQRGLTPADIEAELERRHKTS